VVAATTVLLPICLRAQSSNATTGSIAGTVRENTAPSLSAATVTAINVETGLRKSSVAGQSGTYVLSLLPPGRYRLSATFGAASSTDAEVVVALGSTTIVDIDLTLRLSETITVWPQAPSVDIRRPGLATSVTTGEIEHLPLAGRDFRDLTLLSPGAVATAGDRVAFNGARGITSNYNVDGAEMNSDFFGEQRGGTVAPFTVSQAAIREFQVVRSSFSAEHAKGVGGTLNAITHSGTNDLRGQLFYYTRSADWAASRSQQLDGLPVTDSFQAKDVDQYGAAVGGPIVRDRLHFFVSVDVQDLSRIVTPNDPRTTPGFLALPSTTREQFVARVDELLKYPMDREFSFDSTEDEQALLAKLDWNAAVGHHVALRANSSNFTNRGSEGTRSLSNNGVLENNFDTAVMQMESVISSVAEMQALVQFSREERPRLPTMTILPQTQITGTTPYIFGQLEFLPGNVIETKWQARDVLSLHAGQHTVTTGFEIRRSAVSNVFPRRLAGQYTFAGVAEFLDGRPARFQQGMGPEGREPGDNQFDYTYGSLFAGDTWTRNNFVIDGGVRYDYQTMPRPGGNVAPEYPEFVRNFRADANNIGPRIGFAYDVRGKGKAVLRGGVGRYFDFLPAILLADPTQQIAGLYTLISVNCSSSTPCPTYPDIFSRADFDRFAQATRDIKIIGDDFEAQEVTRAALGWERRLGSSYVLSADATYARLQKQQSLVNVNAIPTGLMFGNMPQYRLNDPSNPDPGTRYPRLQTVAMHTSDAEAVYRSVNVELRRVAAPTLTGWYVNYTWSRAIDQDSNERATNASSRIDPFNPELNEGHADFDVKHKFVASGMYQLPAGVLVSGILHWRSGVPWTRSINGFGNGLADLGISTPVFLDRNGDVVDMTAANGLTNQQLSQFLAEGGAQLETRNSQRQPSVFEVHMRLTWRMPIRSPFELELIAEAFNLLNTKNRVVPVANRNMYTARQQSGIWTFAFNERFGRTNAYSESNDPRQVQLAVRVLF
jgi:hypothetical protein